MYAYMFVVLFWCVFSIACVYEIRGVSQFVFRLRLPTLLVAGAPSLLV